MSNELIETYKNLMHDLVVLPERIAEAQAEVTELKLRIADVEKDMAALEPSLMQQATGKNAEERKAALLQLKNDHSGWQHNEQVLRRLQRDLATASDDLDYRTRVYNATAQRARLHGNLLQFLAAGGQPVSVGPVVSNGEVSFGMGPRRNGNGSTVTAEDAREIGL